MKGTKITILLMLTILSLITIFLVLLLDGESLAAEPWKESAHAPVQQQVHRETDR